MSGEHVCVCVCVCFCMCTPPQIVRQARAKSRQSCVSNPSTRGASHKPNSSPHPPQGPSSLKEHSSKLTNYMHTRIHMYNGINIFISINVWLSSLDSTVSNQFIFFEGTENRSTMNTKLQAWHIHLRPIIDQNKSCYCLYNQGYPQQKCNNIRMTSPCDLTKRLMPNSSKDTKLFCFKVHKK